MKNIKNIYIRIIIGFLCLFFASCSYYKTDLIENKDYIIYDTNAKKEISFFEFINKLSTFDIVLLGEEHDKFKHHIAQALILKNLSINKKINVAFEMLSVDKQDMINKALKNRNEIKPDDIKSLIGWDKKWHQKGYNELLKSIFYKDTIITAANLTQNEINTIYSGAADIKGYKSTTKEVKEQIKNIIKNNHSINEDLLEKLVLIQQYKDRRMADILVHSNDFSVLIAGKYHCYKNIGIPLHIIDYKSTKKVAVVSFEDIKDCKDIDNTLVDFVWKFKY